MFGYVWRHPSRLSLGLLILSILLLVISAPPPLVGLGTILVFVLVLLAAFLRRQGMGWLGIRRPTSWVRTHLLATASLTSWISLLP